MFERSRPSKHTSQIGEIGWRHRRRKILVPRFKGLGELGTHVFVLKMLRFFLGIFPGSPRRQHLGSHF